MPEKLAGKLRQPLAQRRGKLIAAPAPVSLVKADDAMRGPVQRYRQNLGQAGHGAGKASWGCNEASVKSTRIRAAKRANRSMRRREADGGRAEPLCLSH